MLDRLVVGGAEDQRAALQRLVEEDRRVSVDHRTIIYVADLCDGRMLVMHRRGGKKVGIRLSVDERFFSGSDDIVHMHDRQGVVTARFSMGEPPEGFTPLSQEEVQQITSKDRDFELFQGDRAWRSMGETKQSTNVPARSA